MSNCENGGIQLQDYPQRTANPPISAQTSTNPPPDPPLGPSSTSATVGRGGTHPVQSPPLPARTTFFEYLQDNRRNRLRDRGIDPLTRYQCDTVRYRILTSASFPADRRNHECVNFKDVDMFEEAKGYCLERGNVTAVKALAIILLVIPLFPLSLLILLLWTVPVLVIDAFQSRTRENLIDFAFPLHRWAVLASIWIIFVPSAKLAGQGGLWGLLLPGSSPGFQHVQAETERKGKELINKRETHHLKLKAQLVRASQEEEGALNRLDHITINDPPEAWHSAFDQWKVAEGNRKFIENRLHEVEKEVTEIRRVAETEACMKLIGYRGIADWATDTWNAYGTLVNTMTAVCGVGAGLTYTSVTS